MARGSSAMMHGIATGTLCLASLLVSVMAQESQLNVEPRKSHTLSPRSKSKGPNKLLIAGVVALGLLVAGAASFGIYKLVTKEKKASPPKAGNGGSGESTGGKKDDKGMAESEDGDKPKSKIQSKTDTVGVAADKVTTEKQQGDGKPGEDQKTGGTQTPATGGPGIRQSGGAAPDFDPRGEETQATYVAGASKYDGPKGLGTREEQQMVRGPNNGDRRLSTDSGVAANDE